MRYLNIVHLSDLHLKADGAERFNQSRIVTALAKDLEAISSGAMRPDLIIFSGDLAYAGDDDLYPEVSEAITILTESAGLSARDVIVLPGNHDASRSAILGGIDIIASARAKNKSVTEANALAFDQVLIGQIGRTFRGFGAAAASISRKPTWSDAFSAVYLHDRAKVAIIALNTAILTHAGLKSYEKDERNLLFPEVPLVRGLERIPAGYLKVVAGHHPIEFLNPVSEKALKTVLLKGADLYLYGHMHEAKPENLQSPVGQCTMVQSGALYASRDWWNGYCVISVVPGHHHHRMHLRRWHEERGEFGVASEYDDEGMVYFSPDGKLFWRSVEPRIDLMALDEWRQSKLHPALASECSQTLTKQRLHDVFVDPEFERDAYVETAEGKELRNKPETISLDDLFGSGDNLIIAAPEESGKTALIRHWADRLAKMPARTVGWSIPVILNFEQLKTYAGGVESAVKQRLSELPGSISAGGLLNTGLVTIFVDDFRLEESQRKQSLSAFVAKFPLCRFVFLTSTPFIQGAGLSPVIAEEVPFTTIRLKRLKNSQLLALIEKHGTKDPKEADKLLQRMLLEANALSVPITPVSGTFLIQIYTEDSSKPLVNRANLIERYIEISLEKFGSDEFLDGKFDFHNKADLLSDIAERMCREGRYELAESEFLTWVREYLDKFGLRVSELDLLTYFTATRVLERCAGSVSFRLRAFMEYFAARRMESDVNFREYVLDEVRYLSFPNEISFYAAISRRDRAWIEELFRRFSATSETVWANAPAEVRDGTLLENFVIPGEDATEAEVLAVERRILDAELTESGRKELLNYDASPADHGGRRVFRPVLTDPGDEWLGQLALLSSMLKNMELVPNAVKTQTLHSVVHGWLQLISLSLGLVPALAKERTLTLYGVKYEVHFEGMEIGEIARKLFVYVPISVVKMAHRYLGSEKLQLQLQLEHGLGEPLAKLSGGQQLVRVGLLALMATEGVADKLKAVSGSITGRKYLTEVFLRHVYEMAVRYRLPEQELKTVRALAAEVATRLEGTAPKEIGKRKSEVIRSLAKSRLVVGIDPDTKDAIKDLGGGRR